MKRSSVRLKGVFAINLGLVPAVQRPLVPSQGHRFPYRPSVVLKGPFFDCLSNCRSQSPDLYYIGPLGAS